MSPIQTAHLRCGLEALIHDAQGDGDEFESLTPIDLIITQAGDGDFKGDLIEVHRLQAGICATSTFGIVGTPVVLLN